MLWEQNRDVQYDWKHPVKDRSRKEQSLSHGFANHPYTNNSRMIDNMPALNPSTVYPTELWHYGIKEKQRRQNKEKEDPCKKVAETAVKIASLKKTKETMRQRRMANSAFNNPSEDTAGQRNNHAKKDYRHIFQSFLNQKILNKETPSRESNTESTEAQQSES